MYKKVADFLRNETQSSNCSVFASGKKAISPVVAMGLLLVVAVVSIASFMTWYSEYSHHNYLLELKKIQILSLAKLLI